MQNFNGIKIGQKLKILNNYTGSHSFPIGSVVEVYNIAGTPSNYVCCRGTNTIGSLANYNVYNNEVELWSETPEELELQAQGYEEEVKKLQQQADLTREKIAYLKQVGLDKFDDVQFRAYRSLQLLKDNDKSDLEKSQILADLIRNA